MVREAARARIQAHLGQIGGSPSIIQSGGRRRAERGSLIATSVSGRGEAATTSTANPRSAGTKCVPVARASPDAQDLGAIVLPFRLHDAYACARARVASSSAVTRADGTDPGPSPICTWTTTSVTSPQLDLMRCFVRELSSRGVLAR